MKRSDPLFVVGDQRPAAGARKTRAAGFSLVELLTVMAIMALLSTLAVTGYFAAVRGMAKRRAVSGLASALMVTRQRACTDAAMTSLICFNVWSGAEVGKTGTTRYKAVVPSYVTCKAIGQLTHVSGNVLGDEFSPLDRIFGLSESVGEQTQGGAAPTPIRLYNLTRGGWSDVYRTVTREDVSLMFPSSSGTLYTGTPKTMLCFRTKTSGNWQPGDFYGVAVSPIARLPKNVYFGSFSGNSSKTKGATLSPDSSGSTDNNPPMMAFAFNPDGSPDVDTQTIQMMGLEPGLKLYTTVKVDYLGDVSYNPKKF